MHLNCGKILQLQQHVGVRPECVDDIRLVVLTCNREQHTLVAQRKQSPLESLEQVSGIVLTECDSTNTVLPKHAPPERIVQIDDQAFRRWKDCSARISAQFAAKCELCLLAEGDPRCIKE